MDCWFPGRALLMPDLCHLIWKAPPPHLSFSQWRSIDRSTMPSFLPVRKVQIMLNFGASVSCFHPTSLQANHGLPSVGRGSCKNGEVSNNFFIGIRIKFLHKTGASNAITDLFSLLLYFSFRFYK